MTFAIAFVLVVVSGVLLLLATTRVPADAVLTAGLIGVLTVPVHGAEGWHVGIVSIPEGFAGFSNPALLTVGVLFVVAAGLRETGAVDWLAALLFGRPRSERGALVRMMVPVAGISAFLNNTPLVAMLIPAVQDWAKRLDLAPSRLLMPLSFAAILGGMCTLIGTSTNLVVAGLVVAQPQLPALGMFDIAWVGVPTAVLGILFLTVVGPRLLPDRRAGRAALADTREYTLALVVPQGSPLAGRTVDEAGLRNLPGCFLIEIERAGDVIAPVGPEQVLRAGDQLLFAGVVDSIRDLVRARGLEVATDQVFKLDSPRHKRRLFEAVVAPTSSLTSGTVRESQFRNRFHGAVIAVARNGERVRGRIGDIALQGGDLLLVEADPSFGERSRAVQDFLLVRSLRDSAPRQHGRAPLAVAILCGMVALAAAGVYPMLLAAALAAVAMVALQCCSLGEARRSVDWSVLIVIGSSLGIGAAVESSGAGALIARTMIDAVGTSPLLALMGVYAVTALLTSSITNTAAVALTFPIALATARELGVDSMPFVVAIMMGGSSSFATPIGYQTNLMVYGPGNYTFGDFLRVGGLVNLVTGICTVLLTPLAFPFHRG